MVFFLCLPKEEQKTQGKKKKFYAHVFLMDIQNTLRIVKHFEDTPVFEAWGQGSKWPLLMNHWTDGGQAGRAEQASEASCGSRSSDKEFLEAMVLAPLSLEAYCCCCYRCCCCLLFVHCCLLLHCAHDYQPMRSQVRGNICSKPGGISTATQKRQLWFPRISKADSVY